MVQYEETRPAPAALPGATALLAVPYIYPNPATDWNKINSLAPPVKYVIANPGSGPGAAVDSHYSSAINAARAAGIRVLGYVYAPVEAFTATHATPAVFTGTFGFPNGAAVQLTGASLPGGFSTATIYYVVSSSGATFELAATPGGTAIASTSTGSGTVTRTMASVESDIANWQLFYGVSDIFIDEVDTAATSLDYYAPLCGVIHSAPDAQVVLNHGAVPDEGYAAIGDMLVLFENQYSAWSSFAPPSWLANYPPSKFAVLVWNVSGANLATVFGQIQSNGIGVAYVTDEADDNYSALPSYLATEAGLALALGSGLVTLGAPQTITAQKTFTGPGTTPAGHWYGAITTNDITILPNNPAISPSASMFLDNNAGQVFEFFCNSGGGFGVYDKTYSVQPFTIGANITTQLNMYSGNAYLVNATLDVNTAGYGLAVAEGSNAKQGTAALSSGTVVVSNTSVTANSRIFLTAQSVSGTPGALYVSARTAGTSFTVTSTSPTDGSTFAYEIIEPG